MSMKEAESWDCLQEPVFRKFLVKSAVIRLTSGGKSGSLPDFTESSKETKCMPKQKTHKGLKKRVRVTATGKVKRGRTGAGHLMSSKNAKRRRRVSSSTMMTKTGAKSARAGLCQ
jgi:large subunit ribosomal protein L35